MHFLLSTGWKNGFQKKKIPADSEITVAIHNNAWRHASWKQSNTIAFYILTQKSRHFLPWFLVSFIPVFGMIISATALDLTSYNAENQCRSNKVWLMKFDYMFIEKFRFQKCAKFGRKAECPQSLGSSLVPVRGPVWNYWRPLWRFGHQAK